MIIDGKTVCFLGDSITEGCGASKVDNCFVSLLQAKNQEATVYNFGVGGTRIAPQRQEILDGVTRTDFLYRAQGMPDGASLICVFGGTNDYCHGDAPLGSFGDTTPDSFYGSLYALSQYLIERYPSARIVFFTPLHRTDEDVKTKKPDGEFVLKDYVEAVVKNAEYFSFPVLDLWRTAGLQPRVPIIQQNYMPDGLHPNDDGYQKLYEIVGKFLENLY